MKKQREAIAILERKKGESFANLAKELPFNKGSAKRDGVQFIWNKSDRLLCLTFVT